jgi:hypothetical protein
VRVTVVEHGVPALSFDALILAVEMRREQDSADHDEQRRYVLSSAVAPACPWSRLASNGRHV